MIRSIHIIFPRVDLSLALDIRFMMRSIGHEIRGPPCILCLFSEVEDWIFKAGKKNFVSRARSKIWGFSHYGHPKIFEKKKLFDALSRNLKKKVQSLTRKKCTCGRAFSAGLLFRTLQPKCVSMRFWEFYEKLYSSK